MRLGDVGAGREPSLDLGRHDQFAAALVEVLAPAGQAEIATIIDPPEVTGAEPAAVEDRRRGLVGLVVVARGDYRPARGELALGSRRQVLPGLRVDGLVLGQRAAE